MMTRDRLSVEVHRAQALLEKCGYASSDFKVIELHSPSRYGSIVEVRVAGIVRACIKYDGLSTRTLYMLGDRHPVSPCPTDPRAG